MIVSLYFKGAEKTVYVEKTTLENPAEVNAFIYAVTKLRDTVWPDPLKPSAAAEPAPTDAPPTAGAKLRHLL